jgi:hypothetical protein
MRQENSAFISFGKAESGLIFDDAENKVYPIRYFNIINGVGAKLNKDYSYYGYVYSGKVTINRKFLSSLELDNGMYFSLSDEFSFSTNQIGSCILIEVLNIGYYAETDFKAYPTFGGPIEAKGRLKYIDGCTDSLLISPVKKGQPCLNHLHFPENINQTQHTHPSHRIGIVASGYGECLTPFGNLPLSPEMIFVIKAWNGTLYNKGLDGNLYAIGQHAFQTFGSPMNVIAFHPDSDFGAEDEFHPMINRTIVDGTPANQLKDIMTK